MQFRHVLFLSLAIGWAVAAGDRVQAETWTDSSGQFRIEAEFEKFANGLVYLKKSNGQVISVPVQRLNAASIAQAKQLHAAAGGAAEAGGPVMDGAASKLGANPTARETAEIMSQAMVHFHLPTLWDGLTPKYQRDVQQNIRMHADAIDPAIWRGVAGLVKNASELVKTKRDMFLNNPTLGAMLSNDESTKQAWDAAANLLASIANSRLTDQEAMKQFDMAQFIASDAPAIRAAFVAFTEKVGTMEQSPFGNLAEAPKIETLSESASEAVFRITMGDEVDEVKFVKVENRWLPADMVEGWDEMMQEQRDTVAKLKSPEGQQQMMQMQMGVMMASAPLNALLGANTQQEFDQVIDSLAQTVGGMFGNAEITVEEEEFQFDEAP
ncbi:SHD1 domain-containing protein [Roseimaritima ulvae]|uniref:SLA1 homology domain-containing protein n=1 Tax=Roseimaritima ulvae TaxID=980254 RepID=A0A5B9QQ69_9BACT|nr:SHD1 domain-containing protein [Roseimaritima ulvae]QEG41148.1 hypothetical protein UC8_31670 [Roseimaritima ulvae]